MDPFFIFTRVISQKDQSFKKIILEFLLFNPEELGNQKNKIIFPNLTFKYFIYYHY